MKQRTNTSSVQDLLTRRPEGERESSFIKSFVPIFDRGEYEWAYIHNGTRKGERSRWSLSLFYKELLWNTGKYDFRARTRWICTKKKKKEKQARKGSHDERWIEKRLTVNLTRSKENDRPRFRFDDYPQLSGNDPWFPGISQVEKQLTADRYQKKNQENTVGLIIVFQTRTTIYRHVVHISSPGFEFRKGKKNEKKTNNTTRKREAI